MQQSLFAAVLEPEKSTVIDDSWQNQSLSDAVFTVVDVETTGLSAKKNALTEVVAITYKNGEEIAKFSSLVKPTEPIPPECIAITGITNEMVEDAPAPAEVLKAFFEFVGETPIIVGHNVGFDIKFLEEKRQQFGLLNFGGRLTIERAFCTKALGVKTLPGLPSYEGIVVATALNVVNDNPHRAEYDVKMAAGILYGVINKVQATKPELTTVRDLKTYQGNLG